MRLLDAYVYLFEKAYTRDEMPQVKTDDLGRAVELLKARGIRVESDFIDANILKPSQEDYDQAKVDDIADKLSDVKKMKPIIVSYDNFIVDGHHRWLAIKQKFPDEGIPAIRVYLNKDQAIKIYKEIEQELENV